MAHHETSIPGEGSDFFVCLSIGSNQENAQKALFDHFTEKTEERRVLVKSNSHLVHTHNDLFVVPSVNHFSHFNSSSPAAKIDKDAGIELSKSGKFSFSNAFDDSKQLSEFEYFSRNSFWSVLKPEKVPLILH